MQDPKSGYCKIIKIGEGCEVSDASEFAYALYYIELLLIRNLFLRS